MTDSLAQTAPALCAMMCNLFGNSCGVNVPGIRMVDAAEGVLALEWIDGKSIRFLLGGGAEGEEEAETAGDDQSDDAEADAQEDDGDPLSEYGVTQGAGLSGWRRRGLMPDEQTNSWRWSVLKLRKCTAETSFMGISRPPT